MRLFQVSAFGLVFGTGLAVTGATASAGCGGDHPDCAASRTCSDGSRDETAGQPGSSGTSTGTRGGSGGRAGSSAGGSGGKSSPGAAGSDDGPENGGGPTARGGSSSGGSTAEAGETSSPAPKAGSGGSGQHPGDSEAGTLGSAGSDETTQTPPGDTTPPTVVSISPPNGATGVDSDADVRITFSEAMDTAATEAAFASPELGAVEFYWQNASTVLVAHPLAPLTLAEVSDPRIPAQRYEFTLGASARDAAGNALEGALVSSFTTLRHVQQQLLLPQGGGAQLHRTPGGTEASEPGCIEPADVLVAGDTTGNTAYYFLLTFDIASLPESITHWNGAHIVADLSPDTGLNPYQRLGNLEYYSVANLDPSTAGWDNPNQTKIGDFATYASQTSVSHGVRAQLESDHENRAVQGNRSQFLFRFEKQTDGEDNADRVNLICRTVALELDYVAP